MSTFDPRAVRAQICKTLPDDQQDNFDAEWESAVNAKIASWIKNRKPDSHNVDQLKWEANIVKYVDYVHGLTAPARGKLASFLPDELPFYGPQFLPPTYRDIVKRQKNAEITPTTNYLKPFHVIHPFYHSNLAMCPVCNSSDIGWEGWNTKGHRHVHGVHREEYAIGVQLRCNRCQGERQRMKKAVAPKKLAGAKSNGKKSEGKAVAGTKSNADQEPAEDSELLPSYCFSTTSREFWQKWELWAIPPGVPVFTKRCGITRELLDLIIEVRPTTTSSGLAENIRQLHLLEYNKAFLEYLQTYRAIHSAYFHHRPLQHFSEPFAITGYGGPSVSDEIISAVYLDFTMRSREVESQRYMRTIRGITLSMDATFKVVKKATVTDSKHKRTKVMTGGLTTAINEHTETMFWEMGQSQAHSVLTHLLNGYVRRCGIQGVPLPEITVVDSCCHFRNAIVKAMPETQVVLDTYHLMMRYLAALVNGLNNPHRSAVSHDVVDSILKVRAAKGKPAVYWSKEEQEERLVKMYEKWVKKGTVWSAAAQKVHEDQLRHVQKGCLSCCRQDIRSDGSCIEGTNKQWNSIMRSHPSGIELFNGLAHDFVHRRNMRIGFARLNAENAATESEHFVVSTHGCHHVHLTDHISTVFNSILKTEQRRNAHMVLTNRHQLPDIKSGETFGLASHSHHADMSGVLDSEVKKFGPSPLTKEELEDPLDLVDRIEQEDPDELEPQTVAILAAMHIDPALRLIPQSGGAAAMPVPLLTISDDDIDPSLRVVSETQSRTSTAQQQPASLKQQPGTSRSDGSKSGVGRSTNEVVDLTEDIEHVISPTPSVAPSMQPRPQSAEIALRPALGPSAEPSTVVPSNVPAIRSATKRKRPDSDASSTQPGTQTSRASKRACLPPHYKGPTAVSMILSNITVPGGGSKVGPRIDSFFGRQKPASSNKSDEVRAPVPDPTATATTTAVTAVSTEFAQPSHLPRCTSAMLSPIPIPPLDGLTRSQRFFTVLTGVHPHSTKIETDNEYYLFMEMRLERRWVSFAMTSRMWIDATADYNEKLRVWNDKDKLPTVKKQPQALIAKLKVIEKIIIGRIEDRDFVSKRSKTTKFWTEQCAAVALSKPGTKPRKAQVCTRCKTVKYPGGTGSPENHKLKCCSDGVKITDDKETPPPWPQLSGIYKDSTHFNAAAFLDTVRDYYERIVVDGQPMLDLPSELLNFACTLDARLVKNHPEDRILFRLWDDLEIDGPPLDERMIVVAGHRFLTIDQSVLVVGATATMSSVVVSSAGAAAAATAATVSSAGAAVANVSSAGAAVPSDTVSSGGSGATA